MTWQSPGREYGRDGHHYPQTLARGGSPPWQSRGNEMPPTYPRQPTCPRRLCAPRWLTAEKFPEIETITSEHDYPGLSSAASRHTAWVGQEDSPHIFICSGLRAWRFAGDRASAGKFLTCGRGVFDRSGSGRAAATRKSRNEVKKSRQTA